MDTGYNDAYRAFLDAHPSYSGTARLDDLRATDYERLDRLGHVYLDYTGGGLYATSQIRAHHDQLRDGVFGNPHSNNPTSLASSALVQHARSAVLAFINADPGEYGVIFTPNASGALKLVGESYPFEPGDRYLLTYDNHNSVNGLREFARHNGATVTYLPVNAPHLRVDGDAVSTELKRWSPGRHRLFAFPAQSNFSGVQHPLEWVDWAHELGWQVVLDCAAYAPTNRLDLSKVKPDFIPLSFYKIFGYPTGIGALVFRYDALKALRRPWFAGGTITMASVQGEDWYRLAPGHAGFEDGTVDYLGLPAVAIGLAHISRAGIDLIHERVMALTSWLIARMTSLAHGNGASVARIFGPTDTTRRGATIAFYLQGPDGMPYDVRGIEQLAIRRRISIRTGCFCNPGDGEVAHGITRENMAQCFVGRTGPVTFEECSETLRASTGKPPNTMRISLGLASNFADVFAFATFASRFVDVPADELPAP
jgi:molybdenum cofactor sulfurtransferase